MKFCEFTTLGQSLGAMIPVSVAANRTIIPLISLKPPSAVFVIEICADALPEDKPVIKAKVNIAVMKRFMGFLSEAEER